MAANLGTAFVRVTAVTNGFTKSLNGLGKGGGNLGRKFGGDFASGFTKAFGGGNKKVFGPNFFKEADRARAQFQTLLRTGYALGPALAALGGVVGSLGGALFVVGGAAAVASQALIVLPASLVALGQAAIVAKTALMGVGKAITAGLNPSAGSGAAKAKALETALERLEEARIRLARAEEDRAERIADANKKIVNAEEDYIDAQYESEKAAKDLARAREEATENLQQLRFETEEAAISEQKARLEFEKSREELQRVQDLPPNSRARREAELAFAEADLNLRRAIDKNSDLKKEEAAATAAGVDGSDEVLKASEALADAKEREADAYDAVAEAIADSAKAQRDANRQVEDAQRALAEAAEDVEDAQKGAAAGVDAFGQAMKKLSPEAQRFVEYILSIKDKLQELRAAAGRKLFPLLEESIDNLVKNLLPKLEPMFERTGEILGEIAVQFSNTVTEAGNVTSLENVWKTNDKLLQNFGTAASNLYTVFLKLLEAAEPLILRFGNWVETLTAGWRETVTAEGATEKLRAKFERAGDVAAKLGEIFKNTFGGLGGLIGAINKPGGAIDVLLEKLDGVTERFNAFANNPNNAGGINKFFTDAVTNSGKLFTILGEILKSFGRIASSEDFGSFLDQILIATQNFSSGFEKLSEGGALTAFGDLIIELSETFNIFTESGGVRVFFDTLSGILGTLNDFFGSDIGKKIIQTVSPILAFFSALGLAKGIGTFFGKAAIASIGAGFSAITGAISTAAGIVGMSTGPFLILAAVLYGAYTQSEALRTAVSEMFTFIKDSLLGAIESISAAFSDAFGNVGGLKGALSDIGDFIARYIVPIFRGIFAQSLERIVGVIKGIIYFLGALKDAFLAVVNFISGIFYLLTDNNDKAAERFKQAWDGLKGFFKNLFKSVYSIFAGFLNGAIGLVNELIKGFNKIPGPDLPLIPKLPEASSFAQGGTIFPQAGGALIRVAEAGKPERVEPLDSQGLSQRDRAIIQAMITQTAVAPSAAGQVINVYPSPGMDERQLAEMVSRKLAFQMRKGGI